MKRILLTTIGTYGDFYPILCLAIILKQEGYSVFIATQKKFSNEVLQQDINFIEQFPSWELIEEDPELIKKIYHPTKGANFMFDKLILPNIEKNLIELLKLNDIDLVFTTTLTFATKLAAQKWNKKCINIILSPITFFSLKDPAKIPFIPILNTINKIKFMPYITYLLMELLTQNTLREINKVAKKYNINKQKSNPLLRGYTKNNINLALLPEFIIKRQLDWAKDITFNGFPFLTDSNFTIPQKLKSFINKNESKLIIYTMGSSYLDFDEIFFNSAINYHSKSKHRALFVVGDNQVNINLENVFITKSIPFELVFPFANLVVHQGGIGTIAQTIRANVPSLIYPNVNDQLENAHRLELLNISLTLTKKDFTNLNFTKKINMALKLRNNVNFFHKQVINNDFKNKFLIFLKTQMS